MGCPKSAHRLRIGIKLSKCIAIGESKLVHAFGEVGKKTSKLHKLFIWYLNNKYMIF
jgi:hypothetical protein